MIISSEQFISNLEWYLETAKNLKAEGITDQMDWGSLIDGMGEDIRFLEIED